MRTSRKDLERRVVEYGPFLFVLAVTLIVAVLVFTAPADPAERFPLGNSVQEMLDKTPSGIVPVTPVECGLLTGFMGVGQIITDQSTTNYIVIPVRGVKTSFILARVDDADEAWVLVPENPDDPAAPFARVIKFDDSAFLGGPLCPVVEHAAKLAGA